MLTFAVCEYQHMNSGCLAPAGFLSVIIKGLMIMTLKKKKLGLAVSAAIFSFALAACGSSGSGGGGDEPFNPENPSYVPVAGGEPVSPGGLHAPGNELDPVPNKLVVQVLDEDLGSNGTKAAEAMNYSVWRWAGDGCASDIGDSQASGEAWEDGAYKPTDQNEYGIIFEFDVSNYDVDGCSGFILRDEGINKYLDDNQMLTWTAQDHEITITKKRAESYDSRDEAFNNLYSAAAGLDAEDASAHWVSSSLLVWKNNKDEKGNELNVRLQYNPDALIEPNGDGLLNGEFVNLEKTDLPEDIIQKNNNLRDFQAYKIPDGTNLDLKRILRGEALLLGLGDKNQVKKAARIQTAMLIDELYADKAVRVQDLGATAGSAGVTFKVWAPTAKSLTVHIWPDAVNNVWEDAGGAMVLDEETGVWSYTTDKANTEGTAAYKYEINVYHPATRKFEDMWVTDPYSLSLYSGNSALIDLDNAKAKPEGWDSVRAPHSQANSSDIAAMVITESHLRDLTVGTDKGVSAEHQGKYLGLTELDSAVGKHLKKLSDAGVTHIELLPMYDIASINEDDVFNNKTADVTITGKEFCDRIEAESTEPINVCGDNRLVYDILAEASANDNADDAKVSTFLGNYVKDKDSYNWGYDPWHYQVPEGSYATSIADPYTRVKEIREMIFSLKKDYGMNVILDVVYNHTDGAGVEKDSSVLDKLVPWYYNRLNPETGNVLADTCCSDSAAEHRMFAKLMEDTLVTWAKDYKIDAFRFDLMGYIPKQVMVDTLANVKERASNKEMYFFGEGWDAGSAANVVGGENNATQINMHDTLIGTFNDRIRDGVRGSGPFDHGDDLIKLQGFATGRCTEMNDKRLELDPGYTCDAASENDADYGMHPLNWQDVIRISMAGNLRDYPLKTYTDEVKTGKDISYWNAIAGYGDSPINTINYVSKHDNQAVFDLIMYKAKKTNTMETKAKMQGIAVATVMFGQSPVFDQQGTDLLRTKYFQNDSYNTGDFSNKVNYASDQGNEFIPGALVNKVKDVSDWGAITEVSEYNSDVGAEIKAKMSDTYNAMLTIRKEHNLFYLGDAELIKQNVSFLNVGKTQEPGLIVMKVTNPGDTGVAGNNMAVVMLNAKPKPTKFTVADLDGAAALDTGPLYKDGCAIDGNDITAQPWTVCVFAK